MVCFEINKSKMNALRSGEKFLEEVDKTLEDSSREIVKKEVTNSTPSLKFLSDSMLQKYFKSLVEGKGCDLAQMILLSRGEDLLSLSSNTAAGQSN